IVAFHDAYTDCERGCVCMVLEYMDSGTLQQFVTQGLTLAEPSLAAVAASVLRGLAELHERSEFHRDIKPSNILLDSQGGVKISDFGLSRRLDTSSLAETWVGTYPYMSPERINQEPYSYPSDIWSLGLVVMTLAMGKHPLPKDYWAMRQVLDGPLPQLPKGERYSEELQNFVGGMLRRDPEERLTAVELLEHPFLAMHGGRALKATGLGQSRAATREEVRSLMEKVVKHDFDSWVVEDDAATASARGGNSPAEGGVGRTLRSVVLQSPSKRDFGVLARQLGVTRTELGEDCYRARA
ncbi:unnamed protein product, partial [Discosporangium mesarthrocarpum]